MEYVNILEEKAKLQMQPFLNWCNKKIPLVTLKMATDCDGNIDDRFEKSKRFSSETTLNTVHKLRSFLIDFAKTSANLTGTAFPIILNWSVWEPKNSKSLGNDWINAASRGVIDLDCSGSGCICLNPSLHICAGIVVLGNVLSNTTI